MPCTLAKLPCVDPKLFLAECQSRTPPVPVDRWYGKANGFDLSPVGRGPGRGWILMKLGDLNSAGLLTGGSTDLVFTGTD